jgi:hypothetical protein
MVTRIARGNCGRGAVPDFGSIPLTEVAIRRKQDAEC